MFLQHATSFLKQAQVVFWSFHPHSYYLKYLFCWRWPGFNQFKIELCSIVRMLVFDDIFTSHLVFALLFLYGFTDLLSVFIFETYLSLTMSEIYSCNLRNTPLLFHITNLYHRGKRKLQGQFFFSDLSLFWFILSRTTAVKVEEGSNLFNLWSGCFEVGMLN